MLKIRSETLNKLKCSLCGGYLNTTPTMVKSNQCQICGKCFKILPAEEKTNCVRQVGYEAVAEMLLFPCRYNLQGCQSEFPLNEADNHELECPFRFSDLDCSNGEHLEEIHVKCKTLQSHKSSTYDVNGEASPYEEQYLSCTSSPVPIVTAVDSLEYVSVICNYTPKENKITQTPTILKYNIIVSGNRNKDTSLTITNSKVSYNQRNPIINNPITLIIEGALSLTTYQNIYCKMDVCPIQEPIYDTIRDSSSSLNLPKCIKCSKSVKSEIYSCNFQHNTCKHCMENRTCVLCTSPINCVPRYYCPNFSKGCHVYLLYSELYLHSQDCEFGEFECPLKEQCSEISETLFVLKEHIKNKHLSSIILSNLIVKQASNEDELWIMLAFNNLFKCKRFCYDTDVEFLVELIGPYENARNFKYEIYIKSERNKEIKIKRSASCIGWNASALDESVIISFKELKAVKINNCRFMYTLNILQLNKK